MRNVTPAVKVPVNVMRARLTVIGFNIAVVSFQIAQLERMRGGLQIPDFQDPVHVGAATALLMALALSLIALVALIMSCSYEEDGVCTHWCIVAGDLLMYLSLAQTVSGFFAPVTATISSFLDVLPDRASEIHVLKAATIVAGGSAWFLVTYLGPSVSLLRSPFSRRVNITLGLAYAAVLFILLWVNSQAALIEGVRPGSEAGVVMRILKELAQPLRW